MPDKGSPLGGATTGTAAGGPTEERIHRIRRRLERLIGVAATEGNAVRPLRNGDEITNFNRRSLDHDEEVMLAVMDTEFTAFLDAHSTRTSRSADPPGPLEAALAAAART